MYRFSYVNSVAGKAQEVSRQQFHEIIAREQIKNICEQIAQETDANVISKLKRKLPAFCWHAWFDEGKRKNYAAHASGLIMLDLDHIDDPRKKYEELAESALAMGLLAAHVTPSTKGLRLVFPVPGSHSTDSGQASSPTGTMSLEDAQTHYVKALELKNVDACTKDLARLSFCVPEEYFLYVDEEALFEGEPRQAQQVEVLKARNNPAQGVNPVSGSPSTQDSAVGTTEFHNPAKGHETMSPVPGSDNGGGSNDSANALSSVMSPVPGSYDQNLKPAGTLKPFETLKPSEHYPEYYETGHSTNSSPRGGREGVPYKLLVECLQELLGGVPAHGSRNNFIFSMAAYLRYVCNDDAEWIKTVLPTYGEANEKWARTIESACQRAQYKVMPQIVKRAIENAKLRVESLELRVDEEGNDLPPQMPKKLPKLIAHLTQNVPEVCRPAVANAVFPSLAAHLNGVKFWLIDGTEKEATFMCVTMAKQSSGKSAVNKPIEYIVADIVERDELNRKREQEWKDASANKGANKEKPKRPDDLCVQVLVSDMTNAAFVQRMKDANGKYLYTNLEELDLLKQLQTNGTKDVGKIICLCFDNGKYGQERVGTQSVTARVDIRWNWNASSTIQKGVQFFKGRMVDGTLSRVNFCTIIPDKSKPFVYGRYDEKYAEVLKPYITNLNLANGHVECKQALELAKKMSDACAEEGALSDDDIYQDLAHRAVTIAYLKAMVLYIANDMTWTKDIAEFAEWSLQYDLWCKTHFFAEQVKEEKAKENIKKTRGRKNLLELLPTTFSLQEAQEVRHLQGMDEGGCRQMINSWTFRGYIELDPTLGVYIKTERYLSREKV